MIAKARAELLQFIRFAVVGGTGFLVDAAVLAILFHGLGLDPYSARLVSMSTAAFTTWRLNRALTFGASSHSQVHEGMRYGLVAGLTAVLNYAVYALALLVAPEITPLGALVAATAAAMGFSYAGYSRFVFQGARTVVGAASSQRR